MRGSITYDDVMWKLSSEDKEIINKIVEENIDMSVKSKMPLI